MCNEIEEIVLAMCGKENSFSSFFIGSCDSGAVLGRNPAV